MTIGIYTKIITVNNKKLVNVKLKNGRTPHKKMPKYLVLIQKIRKNGIRKDNIGVISTNGPLFYEFKTPFRGRTLGQPKKFFDGPCIKNGVESIKLGQKCVFWWIFLKNLIFSFFWTKYDFESSLKRFPVVKKPLGTPF